MVLSRLIYLSQRNTRIELDIYDLIFVSRKNNARAEITGFLFFDGRNFVQALEGPRENISKIYSRIVNDTRHRDVTLISCTEITNRAFHQWSMGLQEGLDDATRQNLLNIFSLQQINLSGLTAEQAMIFLKKVSRITEKLDEIGAMMSLKC